MKKLAYILGTGVISMAVALTPAFARTATQKPADTAKVKTEMKAKPLVKAGAARAKVNRVVKGKTLKSKKAVKTRLHSKAAASRKHYVKKYRGKKISMKHAGKRLSRLEKGKKIVKNTKTAPVSGK